jgi:hypothetical protein
MNVDTDVFNAIIDERDQLRSEVTVLRAFLCTIADTVTELGDHLSAAWVPAAPSRTRSGPGRHAQGRRHLHIAR